MSPQNQIIEICPNLPWTSKIHYTKSYVLCAYRQLTMPWRHCTVSSPMSIDLHRGILCTVRIEGGPILDSHSQSVEEIRLTVPQSRSQQHRFLLPRHYVLISDYNLIKIHVKPPGTGHCRSSNFIKYTLRPLRRVLRLWRDLEIISTHEEQQHKVSRINQCCI